jgi:ABC-type xylose transport system permease subunit
MAFPRKLKELCTPAFIYFLLSVIGIVATVVSNLGGRNNMYTLGHFSTPVPNTWLVLIINIIYILFWTWILNLMCKDGHREIAWFLVLLPFVLFFILLFTMRRTGMEGFKNPEDEDEDEDEPMEAFTTKKTMMGGLPVPNGYY